MGPFERLSLRLEQADRILQGLGRRAFFALSIAVAIAYSLFFFSPKWRLFLTPLDGTFEWTRALTFLQQIREPLAIEGAREPAMRWRLLPPLVAKGLHLEMSAVFLLPWLGILACLGYWSNLLLRQGLDRATTLLFLCILSGTGGFVTATNLLGINDAWVMLGLSVVAFSPSALAVAAAGLLAPWIDERFLIGLPLAFLCRTWLAGLAFDKRVVAPLIAAVSLYVLARLFHEISAADPSSRNFVAEVADGLSAYWRWLALGWWMGFRAAWIGVVFTLLWAAWSLPRHQWLLLLLAAAGSAIAMVFLAADSTRSSYILLPLLIASPVIAVRHFGAAATRLACASIMGLNALLPLAWVTHSKIWPIMPLPFELLVLLRT